MRPNKHGGTSMTPEKAAELFAVASCGMVASMYLHKNVEPSEDTIELLQSGDITLRAIAELADSLGFRAELSVKGAGNDT